MKRITSITLENFRAFYGQYEPLELLNGENLLLYGENGSGKSSLYKALKQYFQSSRDATLPFELNEYAITAPVTGKVGINFSDVDPTTQLPLAGTESFLTYSNTVSDHNQSFVKDADLVKGFLDYKNLLEVYLKSNPNLFNLIINELLANHIPVGETETIGVKWNRIITTLKTTDRRYNIHWTCLTQLTAFEGVLRNLLNRIFRRLNYTLIKYFKLNLRVGYQLQHVVYDNRPWIKNASQDLRLELRLNGINLANHTDYLNEARLSALAICLYLSSVRENPIAFDYKILFLDDVFIGLDASNRYPILNILKNEFADYQIFITTYDRNWYELAQRFFLSKMPGKWVYSNLYVGKGNNTVTNFEMPLMVQKVDNFANAVYYLHHSTRPDYPASANYFRKFAEDILSNKLPPHEVRNADDLSLIETYKLGKLVKTAAHFFYKIGINGDLIVELENSLPTLLHPLSHFELSSPIYKVELVAIQILLSKLDTLLDSIAHNYRVFIPEGRMFKLNFTINATDTGHFEIYTQETIYLLRDGLGSINLSTGNCHSKTSYIISNGAEIERHNFSNSDSRAKYSSIINAYQNVTGYLLTLPRFHHIAIAANYATEFTIDLGAGWQRIFDLMIW